MSLEEQQRRTDSFKIIQVKQPLGDFYIASIPAKTLVEITDFDVRRVLMKDRDVERYLGIQRPLSPKRVKTLQKYVGTVDACFPTGVIIAVPTKCVELNAEKNEMSLCNFLDSEEDDEIVIYRKIARVLDGQHRLAGLKGFTGDFEVNVSIFVDLDISDQANIFSTVNLAQTKVSKSLAYDLYDVMKARSPQKMCHNIAVMLDRDEDSPFHKRIKRLGVATPYRSEETLSQWTFIEPLLKLMTNDPMGDRDLFLRGKQPKKVSDSLLRKHIFQHMFLDKRDFEITDIIWRYFSAVRARWPETWKDTKTKGKMLNRTNGYRALIRFLVYLINNKFHLNSVPSEEQFYEELKKIKIEDSDFNVDNFKPGSSGESRLYKSLLSGALHED